MRDESKTDLTFSCTLLAEKLKGKSCSVFR